jgi:hypothetical protein
MELLAIEWMKAFNVIGFSFMMVFLLLLLIVIVLNIFGKLFSSEAKLSKSSGIDNTGSILSDNDITAIGMALYLYHKDEHDEESNILTFKRANRYHSSWNSKHSV